MRRASAVTRSAMKVVAAASVTVGGRRAARCCLRAWDGGDEYHSGYPQGAGLALLSWRRVWTWVWAWLRVAVVAR